LSNSKPMGISKTILVTGSEGFTGRYVVQTFREHGYQVVGLVHRNPRKGEIACDLLDKKELRLVLKEVHPDGIIHLAALAFVGEEEATAFYGVNIFGALNIFEGLQKEHIFPEKIVIASSANVYGNPKKRAVDESVVPEPVNHYAASKLAMEYMVKLWFKKFPVLITRPFNYTGPGQDKRFLVPKIVDHFKKKLKKIELGNLDVAREFSDVRDVADIYLQLYESSAYSEIVNICSGKAYQLRDIITMMNDIAGYDIEVEQNPLFMRENEIKVLRGDPTLLKSIINLSPSFALRETLLDMYHA